MKQPPVHRWRREQLAYCSNVHAGESLAEVRAVVQGHVAAVRERRGLDSMAAGLWLSAECAGQLARNSQDLRAFGELLTESGIEICTLNGFPYGDFHSDRVKTSVYEPDWSDVKRFSYTLKLAELLAALLPDSRRFGTISTLPLGYAEGWTDERQNLSVATLSRLAEALEGIERETGRRIVVCLEMEPGCVLERTAQVLKLFRVQLPAMAAGTSVSAESIRRYIGVCFDVCHQAVMFEDPAKSLRKLHKAGIFVGKIQLSSALEVVQPNTPDLVAELARFDEPRYLHQVRARGADGKIRAAADLGDALADEGFSRETIWRVHFHVPVQASSLADVRLRTTRRLVEGVFDVLAAEPGLQPHLEVETYTWQQLPDALRPVDDESLHRGITAELEWVESELAARDLLAGGGA